MGLHSRCGSLCARFALRRFVLDHYGSGDNRVGHRFGFLGHSGLCHGFDAGESGDDFGHFLWLDVRVGRNRFGLFGWLADRTSIDFIFRVSAWLPLLGIIAGFLPDMKEKKRIL